MLRLRLVNFISHALCARKRTPATTVVETLAAILVSLVAFAVTETAARAAEYHMDVIGSLGGSYARARAINGDRIVGYGYTSANVEHAFLYDGALMDDLGTLGGAASRAYDVNASGLTGGWAQTSSGITSPVLWGPSGIVELPTLGSPGGTVWAVDDLGRAVGSSYVSAGVYRATLWQGSVAGDLSTFGGSNSVAYDINVHGQIVGAAQDANGTQWAALWDGESPPVSLGGLAGSTGSAARGINDQGQIIFWNYGLSRASFWDAAQMIDLGTLGGEESWAYGLNNAGQVVGWGELDSGIYHAFVWADDNGNGLTDPNEMQDLGTLGGLFSSAYGISDQGVIVGYAQDTNYQWQAVRWTPVPEPATAYLLVLGVAALFWQTKRCGRASR